MVLAALGLNPSYQSLLRLLETRPFGTPFRNLQKLQQLNVKVILRELALEEILPVLNSNQLIIASVNTADFNYWPVDVDHAIVVVGVDSTNVLLHDPSLKHDPISVSHAEFALAQLKFDHLCAIIRR